MTHPPIPDQPLQGMEHAVDGKFTQKHFIAGLRSGRLVAMRHISGGRWHCKCDCGVEVVRKAHELVAGRSVSCGCKRTEAKARTVALNGLAKAMRQRLCAEDLARVLTYDAATGAFRWLRAPRFNIPAGSPAGSVNPATGYLQIGIGRCTYPAHRLAWLLMTGAWPEQQIDHINGDRADNRFVNLRDASAAANTQNRRRPTKANTTGFLGVTKTGSAGKPYRAQITISGRPTYIGIFATAAEAHKAYLARKRSVHEGCTI